MLQCHCLRHWLAKRSRDGELLPAMPELLPIPRSTPERSTPPVSKTRGGHLHRLTVLTPTVRTAVNVAIRSGYTFTTAGQVQAVTVCPAGDKTAVYARHNGVPSFLREPTHTQAKPGGAKRVCYFLRGSTQLLPRRHLGAHTAPITTLVVCSIYTGRQRVQQCLSPHVEETPSAPGP